MLSRNLPSFVASCTVNIARSTRGITVDIAISCSRMPSAAAWWSAAASQRRVFAAVQADAECDHWRLQCLPSNGAYGTKRQQFICDMLGVPLLVTHDGSVW